jgi:hypothetical protein
MLNSAVGVTLPGTSTAPPIATTRPTRPSAAASALSAERDVGERPERNDRELSLVTPRQVDDDAHRVRRLPQGLDGRPIR